MIEWCHMATSRVSVRSVLAANLVALLLLVPIAARAAASVKAAAKGIRVEASETSVNEILTLMGQNLGLRYRSAIKLDRVLTGTYEGPLVQVLKRLLNGYDYVIKSESNSIEVVIVNMSKDIKGAVTVANSGRGSQTAATETDAGKRNLPVARPPNDMPSSPLMPAPAAPSPEQPAAAPSPSPTLAAAPAATPQQPSATTLQVPGAALFEAAAFNSRPPPPTVATAAAPVNPTGPQTRP